MESSQFRMRIPKELHAIIKRVACDENKTMTNLFLEIFYDWAYYYVLEKDDLDSKTEKLIKSYLERENPCK